MSEPPSEQDRFPYPNHQVVAIAADDAAVTRGIDRLDEVGFGAGLVDVLSGTEGAKKIDPDGSGHGFAGRLKRGLQDIAGNEPDAAREYSQHLQQGGKVIAVTVSDRDEAKRASAVLRDHAFEGIRYFGSATVETF